MAHEVGDADEVPGSWLAQPHVAGFGVGDGTGEWKWLKW